MLGETSRLLSSIPHVSHRFFGRIGGTSPSPWRGLNVSFSVNDSPARVEENLARVRFQIGVPRRALFFAKQVHGATVLRVTRDMDPDEVAEREADALFATDEGVAVGVRTADCAPVLLASRDGGCVAAVHAGWRGAVGGVVEATLAAMAEAGFPADALIAAVGPCIGIDAFEVGPKVVEAARAVVDIDGLVRPGVGDRAHLDLRGLVVRILEKAGVREVERVGGSTAAELDRYFSHRAEGGRTGRQASVIARTDPPMLDAGTFT